jgi:hypothetical protein
MNEARAIAYAVQVFDAPGSDEESLWRQFLGQPYLGCRQIGGGYSLVSESDQRELRDAWYKQLEREAGLEWKIEPYDGQRE